MTLDAILLTTDSPAWWRFHPKVQPLTLSYTSSDEKGIPLSNDPGKKGSNFFCYGTIRFPHIEMFSFLRGECINLQKGCLRKKTYLNSTFKRCIFVLKHFDQSQELQTTAKKCSQFYMIRTYDFCVT